MNQEVITIDDSDDAEASDDDGDIQADSAAAPNTADHCKRKYVPAVWPHHVVHLKTNYNPDGIPLPFTQRFDSCGCEKRCRHHKCRNAALNVLCSPNCCPFGGQCGNGLAESTSLRLMQDATTMAYAVIATAPIKKGIIIGEYLGRLTMIPPRSRRIPNRGYRFIFRDAPLQSGQWRACVDAENFGSLMRFVNHSCSPTARFHEMGNGRNHTVVVVTIAAVNADEEITVDYGDELWFVCRCKARNCVDRDRHDDVQL